MNIKMMSAVTIIILCICIFATVVYAKGSSLFSKRPNIIVTLKNEADIEKSKTAILQIPQIKIIKTIYRDEEWSRMVNKMDLPKMDNPFKNEFIIRLNKNADKDEIFNKIKDMSFVEKVEDESDTGK